MIAKPAGLRARAKLKLSGSDPARVPEAVTLTEEEADLLAEAEVAWATGDPMRAAELVEGYIRLHPERKAAFLAARNANAEQPDRVSPFAPIECLRCKRTTPYAGRLHLREGKVSWGFWLGDVGELLGGREAFDVYRCSGCGHVELFAPDSTRATSP